ncbi:hypothetical protein GCM10020220_102160 [Nonomuraea rubra]
MVTNRNAIPRDPAGAWYTSGIRLGTPALTTRGLNQADMDRIAHLIHTVLTGTQPATTPDGSTSPAKYTLDANVRDQVSEEAADLMAGYPPLPGGPHQLRKKRKRPAPPRGGAGASM